MLNLKTGGNKVDIEPRLICDSVYGFIYKVTNTINHKSYVGQHIGISFGNYWGSGTLLNRAYEKYGKDKFKRRIIDYASSKKELDFLEKYYIQLFKTAIPSGYNIAEGGHGGFTGSATEETRRKISEALKGKPKSLKARKKQSEVRKGIRIPHSEETRRKISVSRLGIEPWNKGKGIEIDQFTLDGAYIRTWRSLTEAERHGYNMSKISECLHGRRKHHKNYLWRFSNE